MHIYSGPVSLFSRKVEIALAEKGLAYTSTIVPFSQTQGYSPRHEAVLAVNPKGQVPVLVDGAVTLYDSTVILEYLEDAYPDPPLYPKDAAGRARCRLLELDADEVLLEPVKKLMFRTEPPTDPALREQQEDIARQVTGSIARGHERLDGLLSGKEFLCGVFTAADIATFMTVLWSLRLGGPSISHLPNLRSWYLRLADRKAFTQAVEAIAAADREISHPVVMTPV